MKCTGAAILIQVELQGNLKGRLSASMKNLHAIGDRVSISSAGLSLHECRGHSAVEFVLSICGERASALPWCEALNGTYCLLSHRRSGSDR